MRKLLNNKKGQEFLGEHVVNILIAVFGIVILLTIIGLLVNLLISSNREDKKAKAELDKLKEIIMVLQEDNAGKTEYLLLGMEKWELVGWPYENINTAFCSYSGWKNCLCFCDTSNDISTDAHRKDCDEKKICMEIKADTFVINEKDDKNVLSINLETLESIEIVYDNALKKLTINQK